MKIYKDIIQGTDEWKELRYRKVGGSTLSDVMANDGKPVELNAVFYKLLHEFMEDFQIDDNEFISEAMAIGNRLEPEAADLFSQVYGKEVHEIGWAELDEFIGISPDRIVCSLEKITEALEIKCPQGNTYAKYLCNNQLAIDDYCWQLVHYFLTFENLEKLNFMIYRPENLIKKHILIEITLDTVINTSKKHSATVRELVQLAKIRLSELIIAIENKLNELQTPNY